MSLTHWKFNGNQHQSQKQNYQVENKSSMKTNI